MPFEVVFGCVLITRFVLPFTILRWPLPGVLACLVVDGVDQTIFQWFGYDPPFYQGYDKAMDVFYLGVAYVSTHAELGQPVTRSTCRASCSSTARSVWWRSS